MDVELRPATVDDVERIAELWEPAWRDGHLGGVPDGLVAIRDSADFRRRAALVQPHAIVAVRDGVVVGFVATKDDELDQLFLDAAARGAGVADALLRAGEEAIAAAGHGEAWLAVVATNARARRFYERNGWTDGGAFTYLADTADGTFEVPCRRYEKRVGPDA